MRSPRAAFSSIFDNPVLVGTVTILVVIVAVYISYVAENGIPFIPTYNLNVQVADGGELNKNVDVRIGGARVGQVLKITPEPADAQYGHPFAQVELAISRNLEPLPADTTYQVRLSSVLGGQYIELFPGHRRPGVGSIPDGGTLRIATNPALNHNIPYVDISQAFDVFGPKTRAGLRAVTQAFGDAFAGRGAQLNDATVATAQLLPPLQRVLDTLAAPETRLGTFLQGLAATTGALAPEAATLTDLLAKGATTARALDTPALGQTLAQLPPTETVGAAVLSRATPILAQLAAITRALRPAARDLPIAASRLNEFLSAAPPTLRLLAPVSHRLEATLAAARTLAGDPATTEAFQVLGVNDLGTAGASAFIGLGAILNTVSSAQFSCNVVGLWLRNFASALSEGNTASNWLRADTIIDPAELIQSASGTPSADLHINPSPIEGGGQCQAGNEVYSGTQSFSYSGRTSATVDNTAPPAGVYQLGVKAGLVP
ncbi:MlaD family protein [Conexibacter sp. DBS9H8]|uniref:MlaD family protein n=1 Tax=Conexibacter sp. DBS9H8 TaxID=2937801 RepID=UPI0020102E7C|nr:MlaD family protein [Conexibacter sp. DBS9H8]